MCQVTGCERPRLRSAPFCRSHWALVSKPQRDRQRQLLRASHDAFERGQRKRLVRVKRWHRILCLAILVDLEDERADEAEELVIDLIEESERERNPFHDNPEAMAAQIRFRREFRAHQKKV